MLFRSVYITVTTLTVTAVTCQLAFGHELPDGFVERAVEVKIRDESATIDYYIGMNEQTVEQIAAAWLENKTGGLNGPTDFGSARELFETEVASRLADSLAVSVDEQTVELVPVGLEKAPRHHFCYLVRFEFRIPRSGGWKLSIGDDNFQKMDGGARYSAKGIGTTMILSSDVAPFLVRARRHLLHELSVDERRRACKINATVATGTGTGESELEPH
jgi:hypothetical protein